MIGDCGYDNQKLYKSLSINRGFELICPVKRYEHTTPADRLRANPIL